MSARADTVTTEQLIVQEYTADLLLHDLLLLKGNSFRTTSFYPVPNMNLSFCFEMWYHCFPHPSNNKSHFSNFKLSFKKMSSVDVPASLKMEGKIILLYHDKSRFQKYKLSQSVNVENFHTLNFPVLTIKYLEDGYSTSHAKQMKEGPLKLHISLRFFDHLSILPVCNCESRKTSNLKKFAEDLLSLYNPSVLSDVQFIIGDKTLMAHKCILAGHSPVFTKMFTQEFVESKTNSVTIVDTTYQIFDYFLRYLYSGEIEDTTWPVLKDLSVLADKYDVRSLKSECAKFALTYLSVEKLCDILDMVYKSEDKDFIETATKYAATHIEELIPNKEWYDFMTRNPIINFEVMAAAYSMAKSELIEKK